MVALGFRTRALPPRQGNHDDNGVTMSQSPIFARMIRTARSFYQINMREPSGMTVDVIVRELAVGLDLDHPDYDDLVRHLVTADQIDPDAYRWATNGGELDTQ